MMLSEIDLYAIGGFMGIVLLELLYLCVKANSIDKRLKRIVELSEESLRLVMR